MKKILVTGANGFVGRSLCSVMDAASVPYLPVVRRHTASMPNAAVVENFVALNDWRSLLSGVDTVVHLAARAHVLRDSSTDPLHEYRSANVEATLHIARQCALAGVRRFFYLSSIKVNGEATSGKPFSAGDVPCPIDPYGISKLEAEQGLHKIGKETGLEIVIIRPPLVYGPNVRANFLTLLRLVDKGIPLPFGRVDNRRDMVYLGNLVDLILRCVTHPDAAGHTFLVSDERSVSTAELVREIGMAMGKPVKLLPVPPYWIRSAAKLLGKQAMAERLLGSLQVDVTDTKNILGWVPPYTFQYGVSQTVNHFLAARTSGPHPDNEKTV